MATTALVPISKTVVLRDASLRPTQETYDPLQEAYDYFNGRLFQDSLPNCLVTLKRHGRSYGYFVGDRYGRADGRVSDEIAMNPVYFHTRPLTETLSTLVHEMVHLWQHHHGKPGRPPYHNRQWAEKMKEIGLHPSDTGAIGGKETGDRMSHYILPSAPFAAACAGLERRGFEIVWGEIAPAKPQGPGGGPAPGKTETKSGKRVKYSCPQCGSNAWARHEAKVGCLEHDAAVRMLPA
tara:strand:+ start:282 stop:992 length:711 start_codon:yes stop_codon:yes gene_type:complete